MTFEWDDNKNEVNKVMTITLDELESLPPLTDEEKNILNQAEAIPTEDCPAMTKDELKEFKPWYAKDESAVAINVDGIAVSYFKELSEETGMPYQSLINLYLIQCAKEKKRLVFM